MAQSIRQFRFYDLLVAAFVVILLISNLVGGKICSFLGYPVSGAQLFFPITYIFGDIFTEVYGYAASRRVIWTGFFASGLMALLGLVVVALPPDPSWPNQKAFQIVFGFLPRIVLGSLLAFWCGEFANSFVMAKMKILTKGRQLWTRTVGSTVVGQAVDTTIVVIAIYAYNAPVSKIIKMIIGGYLFKVIYEILATPLTYAIVNALKRAEGSDPFDYGTRFTPFKADF